MKKQELVIGLDSYLLRKGIAHLARQLPGPVHIVEHADPGVLARQLSPSGRSIYVLSARFLDALEEHLGPGILERTLEIRCGDSEPKPCFASLGIAASREELQDVLQNLHRQHFSSASESEALSPREKTILTEVARGLTNKMIAEKLFLSTHTVMTHRKNISSKLGIKSASGLTIYAIVNRLITLEELSKGSE